jgi:hypothetical protein
MNPSASDYLNQANYIREQSSSAKDKIITAKNNIMSLLSGDVPSDAIGDFFKQTADSVGGLVLEKSLEPYLKAGLSKVVGQPLKQAFQNVSDLFKGGQDTTDALDAGVRSTQQAMSEMRTPSQLVRSVIRPSPEQLQSLEPEVTEPMEGASQASNTAQDASQVARDSIANQSSAPAGEAEASEGAMDGGINQTVSDANTAIQSATDVENTATSAITQQIDNLPGLSGLNPAALATADPEALASTVAEDAVEGTGEAVATSVEATEAVSGILGAETGGLGLALGGLALVGSAIGSIVEAGKEKRERNRIKDKEEASISSAQQQLQHVQQVTQNRIKHLSNPTFQAGLD